MSAIDLYDLMNKINMEPYLFFTKDVYLLSIKSILKYTEGFLSNDEFKKVNSYINELRVEYNKVNTNINNYYGEISYLVEEEQIQVNFRYISLLNEIYTKIVEIKDKMIKDLINIKNRYFSLNKDRIYNKKDKEQYWFENLVSIYLKYGGKLPTSSLNFWEYIKSKWDTIEPKYDQQFIIYICEDILGGINLKYISINFDTWIRRNIHDTQILRDFYIL